MKRLASLALTALVAAGAAVFADGKVVAADLSIGVYAEDPGICGQAWVLNTISRRFDYQVRHVPNLPDVSIIDFHRIHQNGYLPAQERWPIGRRYCGATVALSDGDHRAIWYLIEEGQGFASIGDNVEFCVAGFDRWMVYNGQCRVLR
jgi:capsid protein